MTVVPFSDARSCLTDIVNEVAYAGKRVVLTRKGKRLAAIVSLEDLAALESMTPEEGAEPKKDELRRKFKAKSTRGSSV
jgi:prevent-host-death family protein